MKKEVLLGYLDFGRMLKGFVFFLFLSLLHCSTGHWYKFCFLRGIHIYIDIRIRIMNISVFVLPVCLECNGVAAETYAIVVIVARHCFWVHFLLFASTNTNTIARTVTVLVTDIVIGGTSIDAGAVIIAIVFVSLSEMDMGVVVLSSVGHVVLIMEDCVLVCLRSLSYSVI